MPKQQTLDDIIDDIDGGVEVVEAEITPYPLSQEEQHALAHMQPVHSEDIIAWMSQRVEQMPDLDSYDESKAVSYDMEKIEWKQHLNNPLRFHLFAVQMMRKPDKLTREEKSMKAVILRNKSGKIAHDSKAILVDKCEGILALHKAPVPVIITYIGDKRTSAGFDAPNFDVKVMME